MPGSRTEVPFVGTKFLDPLWPKLASADHTATSGCDGTVARNCEGTVSHGRENSRRATAR